MSFTRFTASDHQNDGKQHLLLAASGSVATIKIPLIVHELSNDENLSIRLIFTRSAKEFLQGQSHEQPSWQSLRLMRNVDGIYLDEDEWKHPWQRDSSILHIELRRWANVMVIAPLSANTMAKMVAGISDNLLLSVVRAWDTTGEIEGRKYPKSIIVAPAMNSAMWHQPVTRRQLAVLEDECGAQESDKGWITVLRPVEKTLACGDVGDGAMTEWLIIVQTIRAYVDVSRAMGGRD